MDMLGYGKAPSLSGRRWAYDVFLNVSGKDTGKGFTGFLYHALHTRRYKAFVDDEVLRTQEEISPAVARAIEESRIAIIVFSKYYASSTRCLDELVKILHCKQTKGLMVLPVYYKVSPSEVRYQRASFGIAMTEHEARFKDKEKLEKLETWKWALIEAANLSGWHLGNGNDYRAIDEIVKQVHRELNLNILYITDYPVGLETRISELKSLLHTGPGEDILMVGIYGLGGIGKTTIARALFNFIAEQFECACFLADIREISSQRQGLVQLQETLLYDLVGETNVKLHNIYTGIPIIKKRLCGKKVLLILDDIDKLEQLQALAGSRDWFGFGSIIIITTRDKHVLAAYGIEKIYEVKKLNHAEAFELFTWNAFKGKAPDGAYMEITNRVVLYAEGHPLALKVFGSNLYGRSLEVWKCAVDRFGKICHREVLDVLRVTYDNLMENEKEIFLDIACFFKGEKMECVQKILEACGFFPTFGIQVLIDQCLITVDECNRVRMHNLVQDMGREIVRQESPLVPGKRSRLWHYQDILEVLTENTVRAKGSSRIQGMLVDLPDQSMVHLSDTTFQMMKNLRVLIVRNMQSFESLQHLPNILIVVDWMEYLSSLLPSRTVAVFNPSRNRLSLQEPLENITQIGTEKCSGVCLYKEGKKIFDFSFINSVFLDSNLAYEEVDGALDISKEELSTSINHQIPKSYETEIDTESKGKGLLLVYSSNDEEILDDRSNKLILEDNCCDKAETTHIQVPEKRANEEFSQIKDNMEAFYASIEAESSSPPILQETLSTRPSEETQKKLQSLRDFILKKFSVLLHPGRYGHMKSVLDYLLSLSPEDGTSRSMRSAMLQLSTSFSQWSSDYNDASLKLESATAILSNAEKLQEDLETNVKEFREAETFQKVVHDRLADLEARKRKLEEQINPIKAMLQLSISFSQWSSNYNDASRKLELATAILSNAEKLQEDLETNIKEFREVETFYNVVCSRVVSLEARERELEEQINAIEADIADLKLAWDEVEHRKIKVFDNGRMIKVQADDLRNKLPRMKAEQELARTTQANIESEWSKLVQQFIGDFV